MDAMIEKICELFGFRVESMIPMTDGYQNKVFLVENHSEQVILRVSTDKTRSKEELLSEIAWCLNLNEEGIDVSNPIQFNCEYVSTFEHENELYHFVLFKIAPGCKVSYSQYLQDVELFEKLGKITGKLHENSKKFAKKHHIVRPQWQMNQYLRQFKQYVDGSKTALFDAYHEVIQEVSKLNQNQNIFGLIHGDINVGNFHYNQEKITLFDFDECQLSWYVEDIAIQLFYTIYVFGEDIRGERVKKGNEFLRHFLKGYLQERSISNEELLMIPTFLKLREIIVYVGILKKWNFNNLSQWQNDYYRDSTMRIASKTPLLSQDELFDFGQGEIYGCKDSTYTEK